MRGLKPSVTAQGTRLPSDTCGEQNSAANRQVLRAERKDKIMSEQDKPKGYMQQLDSWVDGQVIEPLSEALSIEFPSDPRIEDEIEETVKTVKRAIREKVLESYHNGQEAGSRKSKTYARS
jgi:hypothetical protein